MKSSILKKLALVHPVFFAALFISVIFGVEFFDIEFRETYFVDRLVGAFMWAVILGWPVMVTCYINTLDHRIASHLSKALPIGLVLLLLAFLYLYSVDFFHIPPEIMEKMKQNPGVSYGIDKPFLDSLIFVVAMFLPHFIFWSAAGVLVSIEQKHVTYFSINVLLTYVQFFFLILCFYFLCKRVRALDSDSESN